jgi:HAD superfamily hydrolase (TIGR01509 family)
VCGDEVLVGKPVPDTFLLYCSIYVQHVLRELLKNVVCGDEVLVGKPAPDTFLAAAKMLGGPALDKCLVLEDSPSGAQVRD